MEETTALPKDMMFTSSLNMIWMLTINKLNKFYCDGYLYMLNKFIHRSSCFTHSLSLAAVCTWTALDSLSESPSSSESDPNLGCPKRRHLDPPEATANADRKAVGPVWGGRTSGKHGASASFLSCLSSSSLNSVSFSSYTTYYFLSFLLYRSFLSTFNGQD